MCQPAKFLYIATLIAHVRASEMEWVRMGKAELAALDLAALVY
jgi:hypothetical protein